MAKIIQERERKEEVSYYHDYRWRDDYGAGFSFDCDEQGNLKKMQRAAQESYAACMTGEIDVVYIGIGENVNRWVEPAVLECDCGEHVNLGAFTNTCDGCEADYNMGGQLLAPREQWGEETGEHWSDCL